jgi:hypothetical protein
VSLKSQNACITGRNTALTSETNNLPCGLIGMWMTRAAAMLVKSSPQDGAQQAGLWLLRGVLALPPSSGRSCTTPPPARRMSTFRRSTPSVTPLRRSGQAFSTRSMSARRPRCHRPSRIPVAPRRQAGPATGDTPSGRSTRSRRPSRSDLPSPSSCRSRSTNDDTRIDSMNPPIEWTLRLPQPRLSDASSARSSSRFPRVPRLPASRTTQNSGCPAVLSGSSPAFCWSC